MRRLHVVNRSRRTMALTIIEILVVAVIIGVLAALILPSSNLCDGLPEQGHLDCIVKLMQIHDAMCLYAKKHDGNVPRGLRYLLAQPADGSACKRLNLFLRWMVRDDDVDAGLWKSIDCAKLIVPVDVHMARLCGILGLHKSKTANISTALEITKSFADIEPNDPVKYDFALSRIGIVEGCNGNYRFECNNCELIEFCS